MKEKTILRSVENDVYKLIEDCENVNEKFSQNRLTNKRFEALKYIYFCRAQYLLRVVELAKEYGISFEIPVKLNKLPKECSLEEINLDALIKFIANDLSSTVNLKEIGRLTGFKQAMEELEEKYTALLPMEEELKLN